MLSLFDAPWLLGLLLGATTTDFENRVVLVRMSRDFAREAWPEAERRTAAELRIAGFEVVEVDGQADEDETRHQELEQLAQQHRAIAALRIGRALYDASIELALLDRLTDKRSVRRITAARAGGSRGAAMVSIRAVELLHASLLEIRARRVDRLPRVPVAVERFVDHLAPPEVGPWSAELSVAGALLGGDLLAGGLRVQMSRAMSSAVLLDAELLVLLPESLEKPEGAANLIAGSLSVGPSWLPMRGNITLAVGARLGAWLVRAAGAARPPFVATTKSSVAFLPSVCASVTWSLSPHLALRTGASAGWGIPTLRLRLQNTVAAKLDFLVAMDVGVAARF